MKMKIIALSLLMSAAFCDAQGVSWWTVKKEALVSLYKEHAHLTPWVAAASIVGVGAYLGFKHLQASRRKGFSRSVARNLYYNPDHHNLAKAVDETFKAYQEKGRHVHSVTRYFDYHLPEVAILFEEESRCIADAHTFELRGHNDSRYAVTVAKYEPR